MLIFEALPGETFLQTLSRTAREVGESLPLEDDHRDLICHLAIHLEELRARVENAPESLHPRATPEVELTERMSLLAETFPTLKGRPGVRPFDVVTLSEQMKEAWPGSGAKAAIQFVCGVWNRSQELAGRFDAHDALVTWDGAHREAYLAWAKKPWWG